MKTRWKLLLGSAVLLFGVACFLPGQMGVNPPWRALWGGAQADSGTLLSKLQVTDGLRLGLYAENVPGARLLRFLPNGDLLVSQSRPGKVQLLYADVDGDGHPDGRSLLFDALHKPHGLEYFEGWLYVAAEQQLLRQRYDVTRRALQGQPQVLIGDLPEGGHWSRTVRIGPDGWLYLSIGSSCNVCIEEDPRRAAMLRMRPDGSEQEIYATGLRNSVGFDWAPFDGALYATDNGRDWLGDDFPPEELNRIEAGAFYGWPHANGDAEPDPDYGAGYADAIAKTRKPAFKLPPHNAPLGITFLRHAQAPAAFARSALVALHGSWNRSSKDGYKVVAVDFSDAGPTGMRSVMTGFEKDGNVTGRPVDIAEGPSGAWYVSDDYAGVIYKISQR